MTDNMLKRLEFNGNMTSGGLEQLISESNFNWKNQQFFLDASKGNIIFRSSPSNGSKKLIKLDFMTHDLSNYGVITNSKAYEVLTKFTLPNHKIHPIKIHDADGDVWEDYVFVVLEDIFIESLDINLVNLKECQFKLLTEIMQYIKDLSFDSIEEYFDALPNIEKEKQRLTCCKMVFKKGKTVNYDFFRTAGLFESFHYHISESLSTALEKNKITGYELFDVSAYTSRIPLDPMMVWEE
jgi:hypothetical protein